MTAVTPRALRLAAAAFVAVAARPAAAGAQDATFAIPTTNPPAVVEQRVAATDVRISYHRPRVKGREIFGALVPWGRVWRTGSDNATRISFSRAVSLNGVPVPAGAYELFTIPGPEAWTVIVHQDRSQWGSYAYDPAYDVARISAVPVRLDAPVESFTLSLDDVRGDGATLNISWDRTRVPVALTVDVAALVDEVEAELRRAERPPYFLAAMFYWENALDLARAAELMGLAVEQSPRHMGILHRQALILADLGDTEGALRAARRSLEEAAAAMPELRDEYTRLNDALIRRLGG
ncbi:MAG: hypothetical protein AMXMBFR53_02970 [Gemmatimonadota bacterium]